MHVETILWISTRYRNPHVLVLKIQTLESLLACDLYQSSSYHDADSDEFFLGTNSAASDFQANEQEKGVSELVPPTHGASYIALKSQNGFA